MTIFYLIRHAPHGHQHSRIVGRAPGMTLPEASVRIAERLADRLATEGITALYCSPLERTCETAAPIASRLGIVAQVREEAIEVDYGECTNRPVAELRAFELWERYSRTRSVTRIPGGETLQEVQARMVGLLQRLRDRHPDERVAIVSHGDPLRSAILFYLGMPLDFIQRIELAPASISMLEVTETGGRLMTLNETPAV